MVEILYCYFIQQMKNLMKIGALSLALVAAVFMMNTNAQTAPTAQLNLEITGESGYCTYGDVVNLGVHAFDYLAHTYSTGFLTTGLDLAWHCNDTEGKANWNVTIQSNTVVNASNAAWNITPDRVFVTNATGEKMDGECTPFVGDSVGNRVALDNTVTLFGKTSAISEVCDIQTANVAIDVDAIANQAVGVYSGTLTLSIPLP
jgi:hypothetical protein